jgi:hypothetical protein
LSKRDNKSARTAKLYAEFGCQRGGEHAVVEVGELHAVECDRVAQGVEVAGVVDPMGDRALSRAW